MDFDVTLQDTEYAPAALFAEVDQVAVNLSYTGEVVPASTDDIGAVTSTTSSTTTPMSIGTSTAESTGVVTPAAGTASSGARNEHVAKVWGEMVVGLLLVFGFVLGE